MATEYISSAGEEWRDVPGFPDYQISSLGRLLSKARSDAAGRPRRDRILNLKVPNSTGYFKTVLRRDGAKANVSVHRLVALAFLGEARDGMHVCHNNGDPLDNRACNLRYDTPRNNNLDRAIHGTLPKGDNAAWRKLNEAAVREMLAQKGIVPASVLAERYGISTTAASAILCGHYWRDVYVTTDAASRANFPRGAGARVAARNARSQSDAGGNPRML